MLSNSVDCVKTAITAGAARELRTQPFHSRMMMIMVWTGPFSVGCQLLTQRVSFQLSLL